MALLRLLARRLFHGMIIILFTSFLTFFLINQSPGAFLDRMMLDPQIPREWIRQEAARLKLDQHWIITYREWIWGIITKLDFGVSFEHKEPVFKVLRGRAFNTLLLSACSMAFAWALAIPLGIIAAYRRHSFFDRTASAIAFLGVCAPSMLLALLAIYLAARTGWFPTGGLTSVGEWDKMNIWQRGIDTAYHLILPTFVLGSGMAAFYMRQMRGHLLDVLRSDYMRTARAKGLSERSALLKHALRNAINPLVTLMGFSISGLLSGSILVEQVMSYPGLGKLTIEALFNKDVYLVMASILTATVMLVFGNLVADFALAWVDPRIKISHTN